ncbi:F0F1 ATP synthase subunit B [Spectribacter hydrogenoxidans]|uniref:ATP synthase subunit b n=1 Tax=Spectribacter hydrogenoxidans TaxID=3075608 RepID=A0ABU3BZW6_9GAMM|nr:F0F1 ATP synthase subunit B [Salinisphaera sp. W335]MDT0634861.1 F0F1 ATP synthase subunit B [Salinisphaera sp. W335]
MSINATLLGQMIVFGVLVWFTMKYIWPPLMNAMRERQKRISDGLAAAERGARELEEATDKAEATLKEAREQAQEVLSNAQKQANENVERSRDEARAEGERLKQAARDEIDQAVAHAKDELRREVGSLAVVGAERILKREIDAKAHNDIIDDLVAGIK